MGTTKKKRARTREERAAALIQDAYVIAENSFKQAKTLSEKGKATGIGAWMYAAEKAIGEIIRLGNIVGGDGYSNDYTIEFKEPPAPTVDA